MKRIRIRKDEKWWRVQCRKWLFWRDVYVASGNHRLFDSKEQAINAAKDTLTGKRSRCERWEYYETDL